MRRIKWLHLIAIFLLVAVSACTKYERQVVPFKLPTAYPNATEAAEATIAAKAYDGKDEAGNAFGFDIRGAGILPVQVIFDNKGAHSLEIVPAQTFLVDEANNLWPILDASLAYDRINKKTELGNVVPEGAKSGMLAGAAGGIIGAAIGIVTGTSVGEAAAKGAAIGAAAGLTMGGAKGLTDDEARYQIRDDLKTRSLEKRAVKPYEIAHGFIFFPGEAGKPKELRLHLKATDTGTIYPLILKF
ncbi:MAG: hypothetical protein NT140_07035 [Deltaproteobacteria bacterium]|nr:hypothetical protein [Deltaproteobacteria bacterium]